MSTSSLRTCPYQCLLGVKCPLYSGVRYVFERTSTSDCPVTPFGQFGQ